MKLTAAALVLMVSCSMAQAQSCGNLCSFEWVETATKAEITAAIAVVDVNARGKYGVTPLMSAAGWGTPENITTLLEAGADVNARDEYGGTALMAAAAFGTPEAVAALLKAGAGVNTQDDNGRTALMPAVRTLETVVALLEGGADINAQTEDGITALMTGAFFGTPYVVEALLAAGADGSLRDTDGRTAFDYATENDRLKGTDAYWRLNDARFK